MVSNSYVCGRPITGNAGSNRTDGMDVFLSCLLCVVSQLSLRRADLSLRGALPGVCVYVYLIVFKLQTSAMRRPWSMLCCCPIESRQSVDNVILRRVHVTIFAVGKQ